MPDTDKAIDLAYGENRGQSPARLIPHPGNSDPLAMHNFQVISGEPSYISIADGNQIVGILCLLTEAFKLWPQWPPRKTVPYIAIAGKHGNPCGAAIDFENPHAALRKALMGDQVAVMGGEVVTNFPITDELGDELFAPRYDLMSGPFGLDRKNWGLDLIMAPSFSPHAIDLLGKREKRRLLANEALLKPFLPKEEFELRPVRGGSLSQKAPNFLLTPETITNKDEIGDFLLKMGNYSTLLLAWAVCWRASSNTVALAKDDMLIGLGCGQQDRIACVRLCIDRATRAGHSTEGSIFASDAFFPYASGKLPEMPELMNVLNVPHTPSYVNSRNLIRDIVKSMVKINKLDKREGVELLIDAGCIGGVVPADGNKLPEVQTAFKKAGLSVAYVHKDNRGFSKHA